MILSTDDAFHTQVGALLRNGPVSMSVVNEGPGSRKADLFIVDARHDAAAAMERVESLRAASATSGVFVVAREPNPDVILQSMRAGANEFFTFPPPEETFFEAIRRTAARRTAAGHSAGGDNDRVLRRQRRRRHDDRGRELRRRAGAPVGRANASSST